jgi:hypothetical protein
VFLGDLINELEDETVATETILCLGDIGLLTELRCCAEENGTSLGSYAAWVLRTYAEAAPPDEWTTLMGVMGRGGDPGATYLKRAFDYMLSSKLSHGSAHRHD